VAARTFPCDRMNSFQVVVCIRFGAGAMSFQQSGADGLVRQLAAEVGQCIHEAVVPNCGSPAPFDNQCLALRGSLGSAWIRPMSASIELSCPSRFATSVKFERSGSVNRRPNGIDRAWKKSMIPRLDQSIHIGPHGK